MGRILGSQVAYSYVRVNEQHSRARRARRARLRLYTLPAFGSEALVKSPLAAGA